MFTVEGAEALARRILSGMLSPRLKLVFVAKPATLSLKFEMRQPSEPAPEHSFSWMTGLSLGQSSCWASAGVTAARLMPRAAVTPRTSIRSLTANQRRNLVALFTAEGREKGPIGGSPSVHRVSRADPR